jgi:hypothetical protein
LNAAAVGVLSSFDGIMGERGLVTAAERKFWGLVFEQCIALDHPRNAKCLHSNGLHPKGQVVSPRKHDFIDTQDTYGQADPKCTFSRHGAAP